MSFVGTLVKGALALGALYVTGKVCYECGKEVERLNAQLDAHEEKKTVKEESRQETEKKEEILEADDIQTETQKPKKHRGMRALLAKVFGTEKIGLVKDILDNPEAHKVEAYLEGDEAVFRVKRRLNGPRKLQPA